MLGQIWPIQLAQKVVWLFWQIQFICCQLSIATICSKCFIYKGGSGFAMVNFSSKFATCDDLLMTNLSPLDFWQEDIKKLSYITKREHMRGSELMENFRTSQFTVRMSRDTYTQLRQQKKFMSGTWHLKRHLTTGLTAVSRFEPMPAELVVRVADSNLLLFAWFEHLLLVS